MGGIALSDEMSRRRLATLARRRWTDRASGRRRGCLLVFVLASVGVTPAAAQAPPPPPPPPSIADFTYAPTSPRTGELVTFTSTPPVDAGDRIVKQEWDLDNDGAFDDASGPKVPYAFATPGPHRVSLRAEKRSGKTAQTSQIVNVADVVVIGPPAGPPPAGGPAEAPVLTVAGETATFNSTGTRPTPAPLATAVAGLLRPYPIVRFVGTSSRSGVTLRLLTITAPQSASFSLRCSGGGCPFARRGPVRVGPDSPGAAYVLRTISIRSFRGRMLRPGAQVTVFITHPQRIGKYTSFRVRRNGAPMRADRCLRGGSRAVISTCS